MSSVASTSSVDSRMLSDEFLRDIATRIGSEWLMVCVSLGLTEAERDHLEYDRGFDAKTKNLKALLLWRSKDRTMSVFDQLNFLIDCLQTNGREDLAEYVSDYKDEPKLSDVAVYRLYGEELNIQKLQSVLLEMNYDETQNIPVSPFYKKRTLPITEIYAPVTIREDLEYRSKVKHLVRGQKSGDLGRPVRDPNDLFLINGKMTRNIFMRGEAARGKSMFCHKLLQDWCNGLKQSDNSNEMGKWEKTLKDFSFLFFLSLRHVDPSRTSVTEMICWDVFGHKPSLHGIIRDVISSEYHKCLIVIDGLDEWRLSQVAKSHLKHEGLPSTDNMEICTIFWTSRPWAFDEVIQSIRSKDRVVEIEGLDEDRVVEIEGLDDEGKRIVIENILVNYYELERDSFDYSTSYSEVTQKLASLSCQSLMQVPLLAFACVQICYENKDVGKGMTSLYTALIDMMIGRALKKKDINQDSIDLIGTNIIKYKSIIDGIKGNYHIKSFIPLLGRLGEIAYNDLISNETHLVFPKQELEAKLSKTYLEIALKIGLLSQYEAPGTCCEENVSLNFFHKSIQEFLAAVFIASEDDVSASFCKSLSSIKVINNFENVIIFLSGLHPPLGCIVSKHILGVSDEDRDIKNYRETFYDKHTDLITRLFKLQLNCYRDIRQTEAMSGSSHFSTCCISDILLDSDSDKDDILQIAHMLSHNYDGVRSLSLIEIKNESKAGIVDRVLTNFLHRTVSLQSLNIDSFNVPRTISQISDIFSTMTSIALYGVKLTTSALDSLKTALLANEVLRTFGLVDIDSGDPSKAGEGRRPAKLSGIIRILPTIKSLSVLYIQVIDPEDRRVFKEVLYKLSYLMCIDYYGIYDDVNKPEIHGESEDSKYDASVVEEVTQWPMLQRLILFYLNLPEGSLVLPPFMEQLQDVYLFNVEMPPSAWFDFIDSLTTLKHRFEIRLIATNITEECKTKLESDKRFAITRNNVDTDGDQRFDFTRL